jgi:hypothetical protein
MKRAETLLLKEGDEIVFGDSIYFRREYDPIHARVGLDEVSNPRLGIILEVTENAGLFIQTKSGPPQWIHFPNVSRPSGRKFERRGNEDWELVQNVSSFIMVYSERGWLRLA